jgi:drug/metabolite transporter (DMT)-like permease
MSRKKIADAMTPVSSVFWLMIFQLPVLIAISSLSYTSMAPMLRLPPGAWLVPTLGYWPPAIAAAAVNAAGNIFFIEAVTLAPFSTAVPMLALTPVFSCIGAWLLLGEHINLQQAAGIAIIVVATFALGRLSDRAAVDASQRARVVKGLLFMVSVALLWASQPVFDKYCLREIGGAEHGFLQCLMMALMLAVWLLMKRQPFHGRRLSQLAAWLLVAVLMAATALLSQFWSIQQISVGIFEALKRSVGLLMALAFGYFVFHESLSRAKVGLLLVMVVGIFILLN